MTLQEEIDELRRLRKAREEARKRLKEAMKNTDRVFAKTKACWKLPNPFS